ncbi:helix-turn-helix domain-containing protein [Streptomyces ardesiacus]|uniref:hypothetical protein n=1 Tax=Streptomyces ardesiacus TaxID=285564 RepID=UPI003668B11C
MLARWFGVDRSTITRAIGEVRPLLAERGRTPSQGVRLRTWTRSSTTSVPTGRPGSSTAPRFGSAARPPDTRTATSSSPARTSRTRPRPWSSRTGTAVCSSAARPSPAAAQTLPTPAN